MLKSRLLLILLVVGVGAVGVALGAQKPVPLRLLTRDSWGVLANEVDTMNTCAECHDTASLHTCQTCHDEHGAVELADVSFYAVVAFTGDVPKPGYVRINDVLPYRDQPHTYVPLLDFLADQGVTDFQSVTLASNDEGFVTIERADLTPGALLMPYADGIRFASDDLHVSTWLKGITRIIVVRAETPLKIDGQATSMGRLLLGPTRLVTVEQTDVMFKSEADGQIRRGKTASRVEGAPVEALVANPGFSRLVVRDRAGQEHALPASDAQGALLALIQGQVTLVLPERGRSQWIPNVVEMTSEK